MTKGLTNSSYERLAKVAQEQEGYEPFSGFEGENLKETLDAMRGDARELMYEADDLEEAWGTSDEKYMKNLFNGRFPSGNELREIIDSKKNEAQEKSDLANRAEEAWQNHDQETLKQLGFLR